MGSQNPDARFSVTPDEPRPEGERGRKEPAPFRLVTVRASPRPGVDLDRPRTLEVEDDTAWFGRD